MPNSASATCHFLRAAEGGLASALRSTGYWGTLCSIADLHRPRFGSGNLTSYPLLLLRAQLTTFDSSTMPRVGSAARTVSAT